MTVDTGAGGDRVWDRLELGRSGPLSPHKNSANLADGAPQIPDDLLRALRAVQGRWMDPRPTAVRVGWLASGDVDANRY